MIAVSDDETIVALHLEMRDSYGTDVELPHLRKWEAGEPDDTDWLQPWFDLVRAATQASKVFRRAHIVSEPYDVAILAR